jgi:hypothetical protein
LVAAVSLGAVALLFTVVILGGSDSGASDVTAGPDTTLNLQRITFAARKVIKTAGPISRVASTSSPNLVTIPQTTTTTAPPTTVAPTTEPPTTEPPTTRPPTTEAPTTNPNPPPSDPPPADGSVWDRLAQCEAGGNWAANTGNGYYGGLQFSASSWHAVGGTGLPHQASRETQIQMGERLKARQGWGAWPACSRKLGLR